ncbi:MAG: FAD-binding oxidoreductase [Nitrospiraceae bacterium]|nr:MAG: FAD-binding oxidoreductase [Nitrospiraceae bacterium]
MGDRWIVNRSGSVVAEFLARELRNSIGGEVLRPHDAQYDAARKVWNGMIDKYPSLIVYCRDRADVITAVNFARANDVLAAIRSGGHNVAGNAVCDSGMVIDLSLMKGVRVLENSRAAEVQAGLVLGELDAATRSFGLAVPLGIVSRTGVAGLTLGGGIGWLMRKYGLTCDNLLSADIITAGGRKLRASADENPDLFWSVRGGGGNFGIATSFTFSLHPVDHVTGGMVLYPLDKAGKVLRFYRDFIESAPDELTTMAALMKAPPLFLIRGLQEEPMIAVHVCHCGSPREGELVLRPLRTFCTPLHHMIRVMPHYEHQSMLDAGAPPGLLNYWKSAYVTSLDDTLIDMIVDNFHRAPSPLTQIHLQHMRGAVSAVEEHETAFSNRNALCVMNIVSKWVDPRESERNIIWTRAFAEAIRPFSSGSYVNFMADEGREGTGSAYSTTHYHRLAALKKKYDPDNFFSLNQNIKPAP